jgi:hypothetical protein
MFTILRDKIGRFHWKDVIFLSRIIQSEQVITEVTCLVSWDICFKLQQQLSVFGPILPLCLVAMGSTVLQRLFPVLILNL